MEAHAARMRAREAKKLEDAQKLSAPIRGRDPRNRKAEWEAKPHPAKLKQIAGLLKAHQKRKDAARERYEKATPVEITVAEKRKMGRSPGSKDFAFEYPDCPRCGANEVKRAGFDQGLQRFRCLACKRSFGSNLRVTVKVEPFHITCHRCGGTGTYIGRVTHSQRRSRAGGIRAHCPHCVKTFTQGGPEHLERTLVILLERVEKCHEDPLIRAEILQIASVDVLEGRGYTWNVPLNYTQAYANTRDISNETAAYRRNERGEKPGDQY